RIVPLLLCGLLAAMPAAALAQGGAGDDQYQDPFGGTSTGSTGPSGGSGGGSSGGGGSDDADAGRSGSSRPSSGPDTPTSGGSAGGGMAGGEAPPLTQDPGLGPAESSAGADTGARTELPRTGMDAPIVALLGAGLLAAGLGLR